MSRLPPPFVMDAPRPRRRGTDRQSIDWWFVASLALMLLSAAAMISASSLVPW